MRLKDLREDNDYTQAKIAELLNCKQNTYQQYESEKRQIPIEAIKKLAFIYNTSVDYIVELTDEQAPYPRSQR
jgi:transcriptional regulator with XRE-family HTH domain